MKKILLITLLIATMSLPVFAAITPPYFGIFYQLQGVSYIAEGGNANSGTDLGMGYGIELMLGNDWFFYYKSSLFFGMEDSAMSFNGGMGAGYRLLDYRENGRGHLLTANAIFSIMSSSASPFAGIYNVANGVTERELRSGSYGGELLITYYYNVFKHFALRVGFNFGAFYTSWDEIYKTTIGSTTIESRSFYSSGMSLTYGLSIGLAF